MKVILLQDVKSLGKKGEIVEVNPGYARNFVLPKKLGVEANARNLNDLKLKNQNDAKVAAENLAEAQALADCELISFTAEEFMQIIEKSHHAARKAISKISEYTATVYNAENE